MKTLYNTTLYTPEDMCKWYLAYSFENEEDSSCCIKMASHRDLSLRNAITVVLVNGGMPLQV